MRYKLLWVSISASIPSSMTPWTVGVTFHFFDRIERRVFSSLYPFFSVESYKSRPKNSIILRSSHMSHLEYCSSVMMWNLDLSNFSNQARSWYAYKLFTTWAYRQEQVEVEGGVKIIRGNYICGSYHEWGSTSLASSAIILYTTSTNTASISIFIREDCCIVIRCNNFIVELLYLFIEAFVDTIALINAFINWSFEAWHSWSSILTTFTRFFINPRRDGSLCGVTKDNDEFQLCCIWHLLWNQLGRWLCN